MVSCRVCQKIFKEKESRLNIYKTKADSPSLSARFNLIGVILNNENGKSTSICRPCESKLNMVEKADQIRHDWSIAKAKDVEIPNKEVSMINIFVNHQ